MSRGYDPPDVTTGALLAVGVEEAPWLLEFELLELELELSSPDADAEGLLPADDDDPEERDEDVPDAAEWVEPGRMKATAPVVASPVRPTAAVAARIRTRPRWRAAAAESKSRLR